jgi:hypothetical protein
MFIPLVGRLCAPIEPSNPFYIVLSFSNVPALRARDRSGQLLYVRKTFPVRSKSRFVGVGANPRRAGFSGFVVSGSNARCPRSQLRH